MVNRPAYRMQPRSLPADHSHDSRDYTDRDVNRLLSSATGQKLAGPEKTGRWHGPLVYAPGDVLISAGDDGFLRAWDEKKLTP